MMDENTKNKLCSNKVHVDNYKMCMMYQDIADGSDYRGSIYTCLGGPEWWRVLIHLPQPAKHVN